MRRAPIPEIALVEFNTMRTTGCMLRTVIEVVHKVSRAFSAGILGSSNPGALPQAAGEILRLWRLTDTG